MKRFKEHGHTNRIGLQSAPMHAEPTQWDESGREHLTLEIELPSGASKIFTDPHTAILAAWDFAVENELHDEHHNIVVRVKHPLCPTQEYFYPHYGRKFEGLKSDEDFRGKTISWHLRASSLFRQKPWQKSFGDLMKEDFNRATNDTDGDLRLASSTADPDNIRGRMLNNLDI